MKKTRITKVLTAAALSAAMVMSMGGMTAFAEEPVENTGVKFDKVLHVDEDANVPNVKFTFNIKPGEKVDAKDGYLGIEAGVGSPTISPAVFSPEDTVDKENVVTKEVTVDFSSVKFEKPGIYRYIITEDSFTEDTGKVYQDIQKTDNDSGVRYLDVAVVNDGEGGFKVSNSTLLKSEANLKSDGEYERKDTVKSSGFENTYTTNDLVLTKHVTGDMGDKNLMFPFKVTFHGPLNTEFKVTVNDKATRNDTATINLGDSGTVTVDGQLAAKDGGTITISGIPTCVDYEITEVDPELRGYTTYYVINDAENWENSESRVEGSTTSEKKMEAKVSGENKVTVDFENNRTTDDVPMTGIILNFAPYILLVAFAGVFAVLFLRKRKEEF